MTTIAILSSASAPQGSNALGGQDRSDGADDALLQRALRRRGLTAERIPWRVLGTDWSEFDAALVCGVQDGLEDFEAFLAVIAGIDDSDCRILNSRRSILWNSSKDYLAELEDTGILIVPGACVVDLHSERCTRLLQDGDARGVLVRPSPAMALERSLHLPSLDALSGLTEDWTTGRELLIQSANHSLFEEGIWSFVFFQDDLVHTVLRRPAVDGHQLRLARDPASEDRDPSLVDLESAARVLATLPFPSVYARIDMVRQFDGQLVLFDLDLIAPDLCLSEIEQGPDRLTAAIEAALRAGEEHHLSGTALEPGPLPIRP